MHRVRAALRAAAEAGRDVVVPTVVLAELYRSNARNAAINAFLSRERADISLRDTDRALAAFAGGVLGASDAGSDDMVDAHCVATAVESGRGVILTGDVPDMTRLAAPYPTITIRGI